MESYIVFFIFLMFETGGQIIYGYLKQEATSWGSKRQVASNRERKTEISRKVQL